MTEIVQNGSALAGNANNEKTKKFLLWLGLVSIGMLFAGLTSGYLVRRQTGNWLKFDLPVQFWFGTAVILLSSLTMNIAQMSARKGNFGLLPKMVITTFALGIVFMICQYTAWRAMVKANIFLMGTASSASGSYLYIISGLHLLHIVGGLMALLVVFFRALNKKYTVANHLGLKLCAIYWHFLTGLWIYLFVFLLFAR